MNAEIERIRLKCIECGECWMWQGATDGGRTPVMRGPGRVLISVRRRVLILSGIDVTGKLAVSTCEEYLCVAPKHAAAWTRKRLQQRSAKTTRYGKSVSRMAKIAEKRRESAKLSMEIATQIRNDTGSQRERAKKYGICQSTVSAIDRGLIWKDYSNPFSALVAANDSTKRRA